MLSKLWRNALNLLSGPSSRNPARARHCRLQVEELEPRVLLATDIGVLIGPKAFSGVFLNVSDSYHFSLEAEAIFKADVLFTFASGFGATPNTPVLDFFDDNGFFASFPLFGGLGTINTINTTLPTGNYGVQLSYETGVHVDTVAVFTLDIDADSAGDTLGTARDLGTVTALRTVNDYVSNDLLDFGHDPDDFYRFSTFTSSTINALLSGMTENADLRLIRDTDNDGSVDPDEILASSTLSGTTPETINHSVAAGTFFLWANAGGASGFKTKYSLSFSVTPVDRAGNTLANAQVVPDSGQSAQQFSDFVGSIDHDDFYKVILAGPGPLNFTATLNGLSADANLELIRDTNNNGFIDSGETLATSINTGTSLETINMTLFVAGTYFVRVRQGSGDTAYTLITRAVSTDTAGNTLANARNIGTLNGKQTFTQFVGAIDTDDFYKFTYAAGGPFTAFLSGLSANANLVLIQDSNLTGVFDAGDSFVPSSNGSIANETISLFLNSGTYFVLVRRVTGDTNYTLTLTADYAGNTPASARVVGPGTYSDFVGEADVDFYRIGLAGDSTLEVTLSGLGDNADLQVFIDANKNNVLDSGDRTLAFSTNPGRTSEKLSLNLSADTYFVRVFENTGNTNYDLTLGVTPISGSITGKVFEDIDGDGLFETGEALLANVQLFLDANNNGTLDTGERNTVTSNGVYSFGNLSSGTHRVRQVLPSGFLPPPPPTSGFYTVILGPGQIVTGKDFAEVRPASISGSVFNDLNGNSIRDVNDTPLANWTIFVDTNNNLVLDAGEPSTASNSLGNYSLANVRPGPVFQVLQAGFTQTLPLPIGNYTLLSGQNLSGRNFAFSKLIVDNTDPNVLITGTWRSSTQFPGFFGANYLIDENSGKGTKSVRFTANIPVTGSYEVFARWTANSNRANNTPIDIVHRDGIKVVVVNQQQNGGVFVSLGTFFFSAGPNGIVVVRNGGTSDQVVADAVQFIRQPPVAPSNLTATVLSDSQIQLSWSDNSLSEAGFKIQRSTHPLFKEFDEITLPTPGVTSFTDTLDPHRTYYYRVLAYGVSGASIVSNVVNVRMSSKLLAAAIGSWIELVDGAEDLEHGPQDWPRTSWI